MWLDVGDDAEEEVENAHKSQSSDTSHTNDDDAGAFALSGG